MFAFNYHATSPIMQNGTLNWTTNCLKFGAAFFLKFFNIINTLHAHSFSKRSFQILLNVKGDFALKVWSTVLKVNYGLKLRWTIKWWFALISQTGRNKTETFSLKLRMTLFSKNIFKVGCTKRVICTFLPFFGHYALIISLGKILPLFCSIIMLILMSF